MPELELFIVDKNDSSWSMWPWLLLVHHGIAFRVTSFFASDPETPRRIRAVSPTGRVPALRVGDRVVWESLAIIETLADLYPGLSIWPREPAQRMHARLIAAEMRAGFSALRRGCAMNCALCGGAMRWAQVASSTPTLTRVEKRHSEDEQPAASSTEVGTPPAPRRSMIGTCGPRRLSTPNTAAPSLAICSHGSIHVDRPNRAWVTDVTAIATGDGWLYLAPMLYLHSRRIVA